ncbi:hypothetical protein CLONEX_04073 [[Clostridium] nexile DSM 1787]|nr:hypothetical protein CLONEX_04073 [[Clostridium] nexile DSM 1787]
MDKISIIAIVIAQIVVVICVLVVFLQRRSMKNLIENLTTMIDDATKGTLKSKRPDGSVFSDLEVKMNQYLKICIVRNRRAKRKKRQDQVIDCRSCFSDAGTTCRCEDVF